MKLNTQDLLQDVIHVGGEPGGQSVRRGVVDHGCSVLHPPCPVVVHKRHLGFEDLGLVALDVHVNAVDAHYFHSGGLHKHLGPPVDRPHYVLPPRIAQSGEFFVVVASI